MTVTMHSPFSKLGKLPKAFALLLVATAISLLAYSTYQQKFSNKNAAGLAIAGNDDSYAKAIAESYKFLINRYVIPVSPEKLFLSAQTSMQLVDDHWLKREQKLDEEAQAEMVQWGVEHYSDIGRRAPHRALSIEDAQQTKAQNAENQSTEGAQAEQFAKELAKYPFGSLKKKYQGYLKKSRQEGYYSYEFAKQMYTAVMIGLCRPLEDPFSGFFQNGGFFQLSDTTSGSFGGIGVYINKFPFEDEESSPLETQEYQFLQRHYVRVSRPIPGGPSLRAGIQADDFIYAVDGESAKDWSIEQIQNRVRGIPGSKVKITVLRAREHKIDFEVTREKIEVSAVRSALIPIKNDKNIANKNPSKLLYIEISQFNMLVAKQFEEHVKKMLKKEPNISGMILDLRNNPGGLLSMAVKISNQFLSSGSIVSTDARTEDNILKFTAEKKTLIPKDLPVFVMLNGESASAAEIVAGALQDHKRAEVIGEKSFGKGSVQVPVNLPEGILKITIAHFYTPNGINLANNGIVPDYVIEPRILSKEEAEARLELFKSGAVANFVSQHQNYNDEELAEFFASQIKAHYQISLELLKRMAYEERMRFMKEFPVYNLEYDRVLKQAVDYIR